MLLAIDIGNTRVKWGLFAGDTPEEMGTLLLPEVPRPESWGQLQRLPPPERVAIASVGRESGVTTLSDWVRAQWGCPVLRLKSTAQARGVINGYREPTRLGVDRWAALIAARWLSIKPMVVVDAGSACTIDAMNGTGRHKGGWIAPGLGLMKNALLSGTRGVSTQSLSETSAGWGVETAQAVQGGLEAALAGMIERAIRRLEQEENEPVECVISGGDGDRLRSLIEAPCHYDPALVLKGVALLAGKETNGE